MKKLSKFIIMIVCKNMRINHSAVLMNTRPFIMINEESVKWSWNSDTQANHVNACLSVASIFNPLQTIQY